MGIFLKKKNNSQKERKEAKKKRGGEQFGRKDDEKKNNSFDREKRWKISSCQFSASTGRWEGRRLKKK